MYRFICLLLFSILLCSCNKKFLYEGHNGYSFFWKEFDNDNIKKEKADLNNDGVILQEELQEIRMNWIKQNNLKLYDGELYKNGKRLSPLECAVIADLPMNYE